MPEGMIGYDAEDVVRKVKAVKEEKEGELNEVVQVDCKACNTSGGRGRDADPVVYGLPDQVLFLVFNLLAGLFLVVAILSYLMGLSAGAEAVNMIIAGFMVFMILVAGEAAVTAVTALNMRMRNFIRS